MNTQAGFMTLGDHLAQKIEFLSNECGVVVDEGPFVEGLTFTWLVSGSRMSVLLLRKELTEIGIKSLMESSTTDTLWWLVI